jgi:hypothetical protein
MLNQQQEKRARMKFNVVRAGCVDPVSGAGLASALVLVMGLDCLAIGC